MSLGYLLQTLYDGLEKEVFGTGATSDTPNVSSSQGSSEGSYDDDDTDDDDDDGYDDEAIDLENQKEFLRWELKISSRSGGTDDFMTGDPALNDIGQKRVQAELQYFEEQLRAKHSSPPVCSDEPLDEIDFGTIRAYAEHVKNNGQYPEGFRRALRPFKLADFCAIVEGITGVNKISEQSRQGESTAAANENFRQRFSSHDHASQIEKIGNYDRLYSLLVNRSECGNSIHRAILPCHGNDGDDSQINLILSVCEATPVCNWLETKLIHGSRKVVSNSQQAHFDLCAEIRIFSAHRCHLPLYFDGFNLSHRDGFQESKRLPLQKPTKLTLDDLFQHGQFHEESLEIRLKKSKVALQLALLLQRLYPGPWIQQNWSTQLIRILDNVNPKQQVSPDLSRLGIPCDLSVEWETTNTVWREFFDAEDFKKATFCQFFLSFAQLLVDISDGSPTTHSHLVKDEQTWHDELLDKAHELQDNRLLECYGQAVEGCAQFALRYHAYPGTVDSQRKKAQKVIQTSIVEKLHHNMLFWEEEWQAHLQSFGSNTGDRHLAQIVNATPFIGKVQNNASRLSIDERVTSNHLKAPNKMFRLFATIEAGPTEREASEAEDNVFMRLMRNFADKYLPRFPRPTGRPVRIAVLDTGLLIDETDTLLLAGRKRVLLGFSRSYVKEEGPTGTVPDYEDIDGHGTHVIRLLLGLTRHTEIVVIKISNGPVLEHSRTTLQQVVDALVYAGSAAGADADIINLSFGLDEAAKSMISPEIESLVDRGKLIFASASNSGGNGRRAYPAKETGVFAIHATNPEGTSPEGLNPPCISSEGVYNFATFGYQVPSRWNGRDTYITGTSFATPIAAAIAANVLDFVQRAPLKIQFTNPRYFFSFGGMRSVFVRLSSRMGNYDYIRPWNEGMFEDEPTCTIEQMYRKLRQMSMIHNDKE
ncbi:hypothetical protein CcaCcLH18_13765 [Colletotrichum camelliae]|nr:hypothetical protein CcaCcLH18_13765 [Colletotrichum camelliae]